MSTFNICLVRINSHHLPLVQVYLLESSNYSTVLSNLDSFGTVNSFQEYLVLSLFSYIRIWRSNFIRRPVYSVQYESLYLSVAAFLVSDLCIATLNDFNFYVT